MKNSKRIKLEVVHADTCLPCYWSGHHKAHIQIPVYRDMTLKAIKQALHNELIMGAIGGSDELSRLLACDGLPIKEQDQAEIVHAAARAAINKIKPSKKGQRKFFTDLEPLEDDDEYGDTVYAFFVFVELE